MNKVSHETIIEFSGHLMEKIGSLMCETENA